MPLRLRVGHQDKVIIDQSALGKLVSFQAKSGVCLLTDITVYNEVSDRPFLLPDDVAAYIGISL